MTYTPLSTQIRKYPGTLGDLPLALHSKIFQIRNQTRSRELWKRLRDAIMQARIIRLLGRAARDSSAQWSDFIFPYRFQQVFIVPFDPVQREYFLR